MATRFAMPAFEFLNPGTAWASSTLTDKEGKFQFASLSPAEYHVTVTAPACERLEITIRVDDSATPFVLRLHPAAQPPVPINDGAVSIPELRMNGKADSAFAKGVRLLQKGDLNGSLAYFQRALTKDPSYYRAYHDLGLAYLQLGETARAEEDFQKSIDLTNGGFAPSDFAMAMILCQRQQFQQAERLIQNGLAMDPGSALGKYFLALVQLALNQPAEAEKSAREALWRSANQPDAHILLAKILEVRHNPRAAMAEVSAYLKLEPHGPLESEATELRNRAQQELDQPRSANP
ncbi:MAG TPA: tetratricopeptide repeat protein [Candidatus Acidoferrum sp.]|nr:tetratricopeptide repeat protein [Candidatus Acidoferrum sp.]